MRALALCLLVTGCFRAPEPQRPRRAIELERQTAPSALIAVDPEPDLALVSDEPRTIATERKTLFVAGCNTGCVDCSLGSYKTYVVGTDGKSGATLFPATPLAPGYACGAAVPIGTTVTLAAHSPEEDLTIAAWAPFFERDACPCAGSTAQTCTFVVTAEIAARHERIYCGAKWQPRASVQLVQ